ncbi:hypothetical protein C5469_12515 [Photorhabdus cinerea]|uniref:Uncharacterized protein n=1 Tax=Photorhabdus cinerea TaxID=471575 RepID=A0A7X5QEQ2_9GAMM|nr:hypothetical protein [Photorhabdus cinerea]
MLPGIRSLAAAMHLEIHRVYNHNQFLRGVTKKDKTGLHCALSNGVSEKFAQMAGSLERTILANSIAFGVINHEQTGTLCHSQTKSLLCHSINLADILTSGIRSLLLNVTV